MSGGPGAAVPVFVLTGFLGSGKTTLLKRLLADPAFADTAVVVNEFGDVPIDHDLVRVGEREVMVTGGGCLCCTAGSDLRAALFDLHEASRVGLARPFRRVVVETTGIADPAPVVNQLVPGGVPALGLRDHTVARSFRLAGVVATVDAILGEATIERHLECLKQVAFADRILLTKADRLKDPASRADLEALRARLRAINPVARIEDVHGPGFDLSNAFVPRPYAAFDLGEDVEGWLALEAVLAAEGGHGGEAGEPAADRHRTGGIATTSLVLDQPIRNADLTSFMNVLGLAAGPRLLRLKGILQLEEDPEHPYVLHAVQHQVHPIGRLEAWPSDDRRSRLVAITHDLDPEALRSLFRSIAAPTPPGAATRVATALLTGLLAITAAGLLAVFLLSGATAVALIADGAAPPGELLSQSERLDP